MKRAVTTKVIIIVVILLVIGMVSYIFMAGSSKNVPVSTNQTNTFSAAPSIPVKDFAPGVPMSQKTTILIQTSDSSDMKYIVPTSQVDTYVKSLPEGYRVVSKTP